MCNGMEAILSRVTFLLVVLSPLWCGRAYSNSVIEMESGKVEHNMYVFLSGHRNHINGFTLLREGKGHHETKLFFLTLLFLNLGLLPPGTTCRFQNMLASSIMTVLKQLYVSGMHPNADPSLVHTLRVQLIIKSRSDRQ